MAKMKDYVDKAHAVGILECQERHFNSISQLLNEAGIPATDNKGNQYTVFQRVEIACLALAHSKSVYSIGTWKPRAELESDPEEIMEAIFSEGDFEPATT